MRQTDIEQFSESLTLGEMKARIGENAFGYVYPQGSVPDVPDIAECLSKAGGKPTCCPLTDYESGGRGNAKPEFIITSNRYRDTIIVVECKSSTAKLESDQHSKPNGYAVDGALYYGKFLKESYNVIAVGIAGTKIDRFSSKAWYWPKSQEEPLLITKATNVILEPENYIKLVRGEKLQKEYSIDQIRDTAADINNALRSIKMPEKQKPIFIAGILIALTDSDFAEAYEAQPNFSSVSNLLSATIDDVLDESDVPQYKVKDIKQALKDTVRKNPKLKTIPLQNKGSIIWYINQLEMKIKPMMDYSSATLDTLGIFYQEFVRFANGGDGKGLGIVLTPQHLTEFMVDLANINKFDKCLTLAVGQDHF